MLILDVDYYVWIIDERGNATHFVNYGVERRCIVSITGAIGRIADYWIWIYTGNGWDCIVRKTGNSTSISQILRRHVVYNGKARANKARLFHLIVLPSQPAHIKDSKQDAHKYKTNNREFRRGCAGTFVEEFGNKWTHFSEPNTNYFV